jgi:orotate phosphoribosyltransferase
VIDAFIVRKERKEHGTGRWIEGCVRAGDVVAVVEDVITSGKSALSAVERCRAEGLQIVQIVVLVDREEGGLQAIRAVIPGVPVSAIFTFAEIEQLRRKERAHP